jgi:uncharacterized protein (TIGR02145 family)
LKVAVNNSSNALKAIGQGEGAGAGTNMSGFSGLLAGYRTDYATFNGYGIVEYFWSSRTLTFPDYFALLNTSNSILSYFIYPANGFNVRCVRYVDTTNHPPTYPINPVPGDLATQLPTLIKLEWDCNDIDGDALKYDVFFGKDNPPATKIASNRIDDDILASYLGPLNESTTYFWKVIAKDSHGDSTIGNIWRFTTGSWGTPCTGIPTVEYEGKTYHTVQLGSQCWLKENLDVGIRIDNSSNQTDNGTIEKYCGNNLVEYCNLYGGFYEWYEAMQYTTTPGVRGICPLGWHIPTLGDFETLSTTVGGDANALKAVGQATGTNTSGFSALLAGFVDDYWYNQGSVAYFWSSTYYESPTARFLELFYDHSDIAMPATNIVYGFSIRCLKD